MPKDQDSSGDLPACQYGNSCYRQNPQHFLEYSHPKDKKSEEKEPKPNQKKESKKRKEEDYEDSDSEGEYQPKKKAAKSIKPVKSTQGKVSCTKGDTFKVTSGLLLWGQFKPVFDGYIRDSIMQCHQPPIVANGTIAVARLSFRAAARNGTWRVKKVFKDPKGDESERFLLGYVVYHDDEDPNEIVRRCSSVEYGDVARGKEEKVVYVNRYDWSYNFDECKEEMEETLEDKWKVDVDAITDNESGYFMALDYKEFGKEFVNTLIKSCFKSSHTHQQKTFVRNGQGFGTFVTTADTEYELGWLAFSGKKHAVHKADELVGIMYDGTYMHEQLDNDVYFVE
eukprot:TRINITY_DN7074_c0_g1_i1.p1 TRINITY_DN7074_c0_g1~~TRINITY_DN7074_c0_g1_i1.p1  ORF type:complete len:339 (+),score=106.93 TRINITY_DN7074_c0_g1_i1:33-1049(+)